MVKQVQGKRKGGVPLLLALLLLLPLPELPELQMLLA